MSRMDPAAYRRLLRLPRWQKKRLTVLSERRWRCERCGEDDKALNVHHTYYDYYDNRTLPWEYPDESYWVLCDDCHDEAGALQREERQVVDSLPKPQLVIALGVIKALVTTEYAKSVTIDTLEEARGVGYAYGLSPEQVLALRRDKPDRPNQVHGSALTRAAESLARRAMTPGIDRRTAVSRKIQPSPPSAQLKTKRPNDWKSQLFAHLGILSFRSHLIAIGAMKALWTTVHAGDIHIGRHAVASTDDCHFLGAHAEAIGVAWVYQVSDIEVAARAEANGRLTGQELTALCETFASLQERAARALREHLPSPARHAVDLTTRKKRDRRD